MAMEISSKITVVTPPRVDDSADALVLDFQPPTLDKAQVESMITIASRIPNLTSLSLQDRLTWVTFNPKLTCWVPDCCLVSDAHCELLSKHEKLQTLKFIDCGMLTMTAFKALPQFKSLTKLELLGCSISPHVMSDLRGDYAPDKVKAIGALLNQCKKLVDLTIEIRHPGPRTDQGYRNQVLPQQPEALLAQLAPKQDLSSMRLYCWVEKLPKMRLAPMQRFVCEHPQLQEFIYGNPDYPELRTKFAPPELRTKFAPHDFEIARTPPSGHKVAAIAIKALLPTLLEQAAKSGLKENPSSGKIPLAAQKIASYDKDTSSEMQKTKLANLAALALKVTSLIPRKYQPLLRDTALLVAHAHKIAFTEEEAANPFCSAKLGHAHRSEILQTMSEELRMLMAYNGQAASPEAFKEGKQEGKTDAPAEDGKSKT